MIDELWKQEENQGFAIVKLRHPRSAQSNLFAFSHRDKNVFEVNQLEDGKRWVRDTFFLSHVLGFINEILILPSGLGLLTIQCSQMDLCF